MEEELPTGAEGTERSEPVDGIPPLPPELSAKEEEVKRLVDAGATSPEELRALAAKLQEQRDYEATLWRREVRPALIQSKKRRFSLVDLRESRQEKSNSGFGLAAMLLAGVLLMLAIATQTSFLWLLIPVVGVFVYAWLYGRQPPEGTDAPESAPPSPSD